MLDNQESNQTDLSVNSLSSSQIASIKIDLIEPDPNRPRKFFASDSLELLKQSIASTTLIEPILIRENESKPGSYLIVDGERRWRSCKEPGLDEIASRILPKDSFDYAVVSFSQNVHRDDFTTMEKAVALDNLFSKMKNVDNTVEQNALVAKVNWSKSYVPELIKISKLDQEIKDEALKSKAWSQAKLL